jgi:predicted DCC family thiol-disulfide oxidoreductase YuxK
MLELVYSADCPFCRAIAGTLDRLDVRGVLELTPIESERGEHLVYNHHGEHVHAPHLFADELVYYGIKPTAKGLVQELPKAYLGRRP